jgi:hypothetical protein
VKTRIYKSRNLQQFGGLNNKKNKDAVEKGIKKNQST